jgi:8-oxo-dGTP pyrophosphatase MutT (NUDIX family)
VLEQNWLFRLTRERFRSRASDKTADYYVVQLADAVNVVALTANRQVILVEQFRAGSGADSLETPGGLLNAGEDPLAAAARELLEETGYAGDPPQLLSAAWANPSLLSSRIMTVLVTNAVAVAAPKPDENEELHVVAVPAARIPRMIASGEINHALAVQALMTWMISELPGSPLLAGDNRSRRLQISISTIMIAVAVVGLVCAIIANLGPRATSLLLIASAIPLSTAIVYTWLDARERSVLLRGAWFSTRRRLLRGFAIITLSIIIVLVSYFVLGILERFR